MDIVLQVVLGVAIVAAFGFGVGCKFLLAHGKAGQQEAESQLAAAAATVTARDREIANLKAEHSRWMLVKAAELVSARREAADSIRDLEREIFELQTIAEAKRRYNICHQCERSKGGGEQQQPQSNGQRARLRNIVQSEG